MSLHRRLFFFFNDTATTEIYPLSLHDALPISVRPASVHDHDGQGGEPTAPGRRRGPGRGVSRRGAVGSPPCPRSEEHTSELQSRPHLVCRLLLEKKTERPTLRRDLRGCTL